MPSTLPWWRPEAHARKRPFLTARGAIMRALREFFTIEGFTETDTACLQVSPGNEAHLHAFRTELTGTDLSRTPLYLRTSPEFAMKKLLAAGEKRIFSFAPVFRNRERGRLHHPEFTLLEWYRAHESYEALMRDCAAVLDRAATAAGAEKLRFAGSTCDPREPPERLTVADAFTRYANIDLLSCLTHTAPDRLRFTHLARKAGFVIPDDYTFGDIFSRVMAERVAPALGHGRATFLDEYPECEAALARPKAADPRVSERFELYVCGIELANGFGELTDPVVQRWRFEAEMEEKERIYGEQYPLDEDFLAALAFMPPASGIALGFDRLVMLAAGANHIEDVLWTPVAPVAPGS